MLTAVLLTVAFAQAPFGPQVPPELRKPKPTLAGPPAAFTERPTRNRGGTSIIAGTARDPEGRALAGLVLEVVPVAVAGEEEAHRCWPAMRRATWNDSWVHWMGQRLTETDGEGRFAFDENDAGRAYRVVHAGTPRLAFESDELRAPAQDVALVLPQHRIEVELSSAPNELRGDAVPYCRRVVDGPRDWIEEIYRAIDAPLDGAGTWTFEVEAGERYTIGFADESHAPVERVADVVPGRYRTAMSLTVDAYVPTRRLVARVTSPEGKFTFGTDEVLRFSVLSESGQELWRSGVDRYGGEAHALPFDETTAFAVEPPDPHIDLGTAFDLPPGRYIVRVEPYNTGWGCSMTFWSRMLFHAPVERPVTVGNEDGEVELPLPSGGRLHVHLNLPSAPPHGWEPGNLSWIELYDERSDGSERLPLGFVPGAWSAWRPSGLTEVLSAGRHELRVEVEGFQPARVTADLKPDSLSTLEVWLVPPAPR